MSELIELTAAEAAERVRAGDLNSVELFEAYRTRAEAEDLNAFTWVADGPPAPSAVERPLGGVPVAVKDLFCTEGVPSQAGSRILEGYRPPYTATVVAQLAEAGAPLLGKTNQDEFAMGSSNENSGYGPVLNPWDRGRVPGGSSGGSAAAVAAGLAPWAIGTDTGGSIRQPAALCGIVGLKPTYGACSRFGMIAFASSLDQAGPLTRDVTDAALLLRHMVGKDPCDSTSLEFPEQIALPRSEDPAGRPARSSRGAGRLGGRGGTRRARAVRGDAATGREPGRLDRAVPTPTRAARAVGLLPDRPGRGVGEPRAVRRRALRVACRRRRRPRDDVQPDTGDRLWAGGQAADHARHLRALERLLRRVLRNCAEGADEDLGGLQGGVRAVRLRGHAHEPVDGVRAGREDRRPAGHVPERLLHGPDAAGRDPGDLDPVRPERQLPVGFQLAGPAFSENRLLDAAYALEQAIGFDGSAARR